MKARRQQIPENRRLTNPPPTTRDGVAVTKSEFDSAKTAAEDHD